MINLYEKDDDHILQILNSYFYIGNPIRKTCKKYIEENNLELTQSLKYSNGTKMITLNNDKTVHLYINPYELIIRYFINEDGMIAVYYIDKNYRR